MRFNVLAATAALTAAAFAPAAFAQGGPPGGMPQMPSETAIDTLGGEGIEITMPDVLDETGEVNDRFTNYGDNTSPAIEWTPVDSAESYVVILQDPVTGMGPATMVVLHWVAYNIPADVTSLPEGVPVGEEIADIPGARQMNNISRRPGYAGPGAPGGRPPHQYTWQVFALDTTLDLAADASYDDLLAAMEGHVIAAGSKVTPYSAPPGTPPMGAGPGGGGGGGGN